MLHAVRLSDALFAGLSLVVEVVFDRRIFSHVSLSLLLFVFLYQVRNHQVLVRVCVATASVALSLAHCDARCIGHVHRFLAMRDSKQTKKRRQRNENRIKQKFMHIVQHDIVFGFWS
jgi:hypothetical protein